MSRLINRLKGLIGALYPHSGIQVLDVSSQDDVQKKPKVWVLVPEFILAA